MNEELLEAWLRLSTILCNDRIVSEMPYNEALICNILHRRQRLDKNNRHRSVPSDENAEITDEPDIAKHGRKKYYHKTPFRYG